MIAGAVQLRLPELVGDIAKHDGGAVAELRRLRLHPIPRPLRVEGRRRRLTLRGQARARTPRLPWPRRLSLAPALRLQQPRHPRLALRRRHLGRRGVGCGGRGDRLHRHWGQGLALLPCSAGAGERRHELVRREAVRRRRGDALAEGRRGGALLHGKAEAEAEVALRGGDAAVGDEWEPRRAGVGERERGRRRRREGVGAWERRRERVELRGGHGGCGCAGEHGEGCKHGREGRTRSDEAKRGRVRWSRGPRPAGRLYRACGEARGPGVGR